MHPEFVDRTGGSRWLSTLPTRQQVGVGSADRQQVGVGSADPARIARIVFSLAQIAFPAKKRLKSGARCGTLKG